jgi:hypothetical protein
VRESSSIKVKICELCAHTSVRANVCDHGCGTPPARARDHRVRIELHGRDKHGWWRRPPARLRDPARECLPTLRVGVVHNRAQRRASERLRSCAVGRTRGCRRESNGQLD